LAVAVVEDDRETREGLRMLLSGTPGLRCVATFGSLEEALARTVPEPPEVLLLDVDLPGRRGSEGVAELREKYPGLIVLMLTVFEDDEEIFHSLCRGAQGYLLKGTPPARLLEAIHEAAAGGAPMSPKVAARVVTMFRKSPPPAPLDCSLGPRETKLLALFADGHSYDSAARELGVSPSTVRKHIGEIYRKLQVHSQSAAVGKALRAGWI
jgi:DNA-binding NarL/FixJ family response regulator